MVKIIRLLVVVFLLLPASSVIAQHVGELSGTLIVLNKSSNDANFIDLGSGETLATLPTGRGPHELIVTDDGRWAIGADYSGGNSLTVFDVENLRVQRTISMSDYPRPHGIMLLPGQEEVIVTSEASNNLVVVNFRSGRIVRTIGTNQRGSHMLALSADGKIAERATAVPIACRLSMCPPVASSRPSTCPVRQRR